MNEKSNANGAGGAMKARGCERAEELVAYLYGESSPVEAANFRRHLAGCAVCGKELSSFEGVRDGLGEWREEVMRSIPALNVAESVLPIAQTAKRERHMTEAARAFETTREQTRARSATAALREFFSLSPMWLRFGTAAAALVFCVMAALIFMRAEVRWDSNGFAFNTGVKERVIEKPTQAPAPQGYTQEQLDAAVRQGIEREVAAARERWETENPTRAGVVNTSGERSAPSSRNNGDSLAAKIQQGSRRSNRGNARGEQIAHESNEDVFYPNEDSGPRLTDILGAVKSPVKNEQ